MIGAASIVKKSPYTKEDLIAPFLTKNVLKQTDTTPDLSGIGLVSDPDTFAVLQMGGQTPGGYEVPFAASASGKGPREGYADNPPSSFVAQRFGCAGHYVNCVDPANIAAIFARTKWKTTKDGLPIPAVDYRYDRQAAALHFTAQAFSWDEIVYMPCNLQGVPGLRYSIQMDSADMTATHYVSAGHAKGDAHIVVITKATWPCKFVLGAYPATHWYIGAFQDVTGGDFADTETPYTAASIGAGFQNDGGGFNNVEMCVGLSMPAPTLSDADARDAMIAGLTAWEDKQVLATDYWEDFWASYGKRWDRVDPEIRSKGLIGVQQIAANTYKGCIGAGVPQWMGCWIRDACWPLRAIAPVVPEFCKEVVEWWAAADAINGKNSYYVDGHSAEVYNNTDNAAVFLYGMAAIWEATQDNDLFATLLAQLQSALTYVKTNYVAADRHITALHPHDYWDDYATYGGEMDVGLVKYEAVIDVLWCAALQKIAPLFTALGDAANAAYCSATAADLLAGLEDYRDDADLDGGLHYAIKTDDALYRTVIASPANFYAAHLLNDTGARNFLASRKNARMLGLLYNEVDAVLAFSNYYNVSTSTKKAKTWGPHIPLAAGELAKLGDYRLLPAIKNSMPFGNWPEGMEVSTDSQTLIYSELAHNFVWSLGELAQLCETLAQINK